MKKEPYFDRAVFAFYAFGRGEIMPAREGKAVQSALDRLRDDERECVRCCYLCDYGGRMTAKRRGLVVRRFAYDHHYSESWVWYTLKKARKYYVEEMRMKHADQRSHTKKA